MVIIMIGKRFSNNIKVMNLNCIKYLSFLFFFFFFLFQITIQFFLLSFLRILFVFTSGARDFPN